MPNKKIGTFKQKLLESVSRKLILLLAVSALIFIMGQYAVVLLGNGANVRNHLRELEASYNRLDHIGTAFLQDGETIRAARAVLSKEQGGALSSQSIRVNVFWAF